MLLGLSDKLSPTEQKANLVELPAKRELLMVEVLGIVVNRLAHLPSPSIEQITR
jgi:hypothetical protein